MSASSMLIPQTGMVAPSNWTSDYSLAEIPKQIKTRIWDKYGEIIKKYSKTSKIPPAILTAFIYIESGGKPEVVSSTGVNVGLMQWNYNTGHTVIENEYKAGRMSEEETSIVNGIGKRMGFTFNNGRMSRPFTKKEAMDASLNIFVGSLILGQLIDSMYLGQKEPVEWGTENGKLRLDRVVVVYNSGGGDPKSNPTGAGVKARRGAWNPSTKTFTPYPTPQALMDGVTAAETKNYIRKLLGKDGALDIIQNKFPEISMES